MGIAAMLRGRSWRAEDATWRTGAFVASLVAGIGCSPASTSRLALAAMDGSVLDTPEADAGDSGAADVSWPESSDANAGDAAAGDVLPEADSSIVQLVDAAPLEDTDGGDGGPYARWSDAAIAVSCSFLDGGEIGADAGGPVSNVSSDGGNGFGPCSQGGWCSADARIPDTPLAAIWGSGPSDIWAIGDNAGKPLHWSGSGWSVVTGTGSGDYPRVGMEYALWGSGRTDLWVIGEAGAAHWDGSRWTASTLGMTFLSGIWGSGPSDVWVVGNDVRTHPVAFHWDGGRWSVAAALPVQPRAVWGSGPQDVWIIGSNSAFHWDGTTWSTAAICNDPQLNGIWGTGPSDVWIVGGNAHHWDGSTWSSVLSETILNGVWGSAPDDFWAVGEGGAITHWNGTSWTPIASGVSTSLKGVWGSGPNDVWVVGDAGVILHH